MEWRIFLRKNILGLILLVAVIVMEIRMSRQQCSPLLLTDQSQPGYALIGREYKSFPTASYAACALECVTDDKCMSLNFLMTTTTCDLNTQNKKSRPDLHKERQNSIYATSLVPRTPMPRKGSSREFPGKSCLDILVSGDSVGSDRYWIDPTTSNSIIAYCDMETDKGGWTLVTRVLLQESPQTVFKDYLTYDVMSSFTDPETISVPTAAAMSDIKKNMGFDQIYFFCKKKFTGRVVSIVTMNNAAGQQVVRYFTDDTNDAPTLPDACDSFERLPLDTSTVSQYCKGWGGPENAGSAINKWGHPKYNDQRRLLSRPFYGVDQDSQDHSYGLATSEYLCDDNAEKPDGIAGGDVWKIFVR